MLVHTDGRDLLVTYHVRAEKKLLAVGTALAVPTEDASVNGAGQDQPAISSARELQGILITGRVVATAIATDGL